ncbi:MAG: hypothetical protein VX438_15375, partial [Planctomycetota bacterium]|nr:hypothetical protein [Planctomycetota bacterium]
KIEDLKNDLVKLEKKSIPAKPIPKISSFLVENFVFFFLAIPFMASIVETRGTQGFSLIPNYGWMFGPFAFLALCCFLFRSPGQLFSQIKIEPMNSGLFQRGQFAKYQLAQLLPAIFMNMAFAFLPLGIWSVAVFFPVASFVALLLICDYLTHRSSQSWCEQYCGVRTVVDC